MKKKNTKKMTPAELASRGGKATFKKLGKKHYQLMAKKRWSKKVVKKSK